MNTARMVDPQAEQSRVLTKALISLCHQYALSGKELSEILGISEATTTRMQQGKKLVSPETREGETAILLLRVYRSLNALVGNHTEKAKAWLRAHNTYLQTTPIEALKTITGLVDVVRYLDAMRGKL